MPARSRGFTLLELLVSMVVIGVLAGMIAVGMNPSPVRQAREEAGALVHLLQQLREYAVVNSQEYGLRIGAEGYQVMVFERPDWRPAGAAYRLPDGLYFRLELEGRPLKLGDRVNQPQLLVLSSDEMSAFTLHYESAQRRWLSVSGDGLGDPAIDES
ncbi:type II secretion system minor pseudopilin GspH [Pseudomonas sp. MWU13-2100]|uniref:type II secretion system minor pseudopilin GspH n=1 Tax=Pseudomonas sp. MWU13-2100 TaxID=2935075 RepID=UPI00200F6D45|nr:type II secretion system minor pseudopilin GspH [Pseudomonas sp. MWU13-2100]